jgi:hypothetical protein
MRRKLIAFGLLLGVLSLPAPAKAASITFASMDVTLGACPTPDCRFTVDLLAAGFNDPIIGLVLNFSFNPAVLSLLLPIEQGIAQGPFLLSGGQAGFDPRPLNDGDFQTITKFVAPDAPSISGSGILATLTFIPNALATGNAGLTLLRDGIFSDGTPFATAYVTESDPFGEPVRPDLESGIINIQSPQPVPEPSTLGLMGLGLAALARRLRRKTPVAE